METLSILQLAIGILAGIISIAGCRAQTGSVVKNKSAESPFLGLADSRVVCLSIWFTYSFLLLVNGLGVQAYLLPLPFLLASLGVAVLKYYYDNMHHHQHTIAGEEVELEDALLNNEREFDLDHTSHHSSCGPLFLSYFMSSLVAQAHYREIA